MIDRSPLWPASPPPTFSFSPPTGRSSSSCTTTKRSGLDAVAAHERPHRLAGVVHVGLGERERGAVRPDAHLGRQRPLLALLQPAAVAVGEQRDHVGTDVVAACA